MDQRFPLRPGKRPFPPDEDDFPTRGPPFGNFALEPFLVILFFKASTYLFLPNCFYRVGWALGKVSSELLQMLHQGDP